MKYSFIFFLLTTIHSTAQVPLLEWQHCYGGTNFEQGWCIRNTSDGGYILMGTTNSGDGDVLGYHYGFCASHDCEDIWILKVDSAGNLIWNRSLGGTNAELSARNNLIVDSNSLIISGATFSSNGDVSGNHGFNDLWLFELDNLGNLLWQKCLGGTYRDGNIAGISLINQEFLVCGLTYSNDGDVNGHHGTSATGDIWFVRTDTIGNIQYQKCIGGSQDDIAYGFLVTPSEKVFIYGVIFSTDGDINVVQHGGVDYWVCVTDINGIIQWQKSYGGSADDVIQSAKLTRDGGFILAGRSNSTDGDVTGNHGYNDFWIVKIDSLGTLEWEKCLGGSSLDDGWSVDTTSDGGYIVAGITASHDYDISQPIDSFSDNEWVVKLDSTGNIEWDKSIGGSGTDWGAAILTTEDGGCITTAYTTSNDGDVTGNHGYADLWLVKLSSPYVGSIEPLGHPNSLDIFYNRVTEKLSVSFSSTKNEIFHVQLFDLYGQCLYKSSIRAREQFNEENIDVGTLGRGIYIASLSSINGSITRKFIIL